MSELERYLSEIVDPALAEFEAYAWSRRHAFVTCLCIFHSVDYFPEPPKKQVRRRDFRSTSVDFALMDRVAHAFKHVRTGHQDSDIQPLTNRQLYARPPATAGVMVAGLSIVGDATGAVLIAGEDGINLLQSARQARSFVYDAANLVRPGAKTED